MEQYAMYLRKSRIDRDIEVENEFETLSRHQAILTAVAEKQGFVIGKIYKEVVSGETIVSRPEMQKLLHDVEQGLWEGVLVMEIERLARGDSIDQGIVAQTFKYSDTLIITPSKTYDPNNEFDEEYLEFGLFMSRREYKTIKRRMQAGREQAVKEGKYVGNKPPFGYRKVKLKGQKGFSLEIVPEQAEIIRKIFNWYAYGDENEKVMGFGEIATRLHDLGLLSATGMTEWQIASVRDILSNPVYIGKIRWKFRPEKKSTENNQLKQSRPKSNSPIVYDGLHKPIIDTETFNIVQNRRLENKKNTCPKSKKTQNPLCGLVICKKCGRIMQRRPYKNGCNDGLICTNRYCHNVSSELWRVEKAVVDGLSSIICQYEISQTQSNADSSIPDNMETYTENLKLYRSRLEASEKQLERTYEAFESGIYDGDTFLSRSEKIKRDIASTKEIISTKNEELQKLKEIQEKQKQFIPKVKNIIDVYYTLPDPETKNKFLKEIIEKITYQKDHTARFTKDYDNFEVEIYLKIT